MKELKLLNDLPLGEGSTKDGLGFEAYANVLSQVAKTTPGPFTIGVFGEWGSGKTSLLRLIQEKIKSDEVITVWFNAWRYEAEEQPIVPLVATIIRELEQHKSSAESGKGRFDSVLRSLRAVAYGFSAKSKFKIPGFAEVEAGFVAKDMIERSKALTTDPLLDRSLFYDAFNSLKEAAKELENTRIVVIIDDLDRCLPNKGIKLLESIKLVLSQPGFIFFLGVARSILEEYLNHRYKEEFGIEGTEGKSYLDKIIQLPFNIPPHSERMKDLWQSITESTHQDNARELKKLEGIINIAAASNPRTAVRFVNNLIVDMGIYGELRQTQRNLAELDIGYFAISRILQQRWTLFYRTIETSSEKYINEMCAKLEKISTEGVEDKNLNENFLIEYHNREELIKLLCDQFGQNWLKNHEERKSAIHFFQVDRVKGIDEDPIGIAHFEIQEDFVTEIYNIADKLIPNHIRIQGPSDINKVKAVIQFEKPDSDIIGPIHDAEKRDKEALLVICGDKSKSDIIMNYMSKYPDRVRVANTPDELERIIRRFVNLLDTKR